MHFAKSEHSTNALPPIIYLRVTLEHRREPTLVCPPHSPLHSNVSLPVFMCHTGFYTTNLSYVKIILLKSGIIFFIFFYWLTASRRHLSRTDDPFATLTFQEFKISNSTRNFKADKSFIRKCLGHA